ncbi:hypothetical protein GCM10018785_32280 [Streptomyces longispororuber]|uniref:Uncharacterized protein n=1 Tax=Streptomyces longispororuber TaxID=68230 RepID=A0A919DNM2_9ACTN|nr:hypothetical protein GCM10018785_32280 [Streptomyces longispororuber]
MHGTGLEHMRYRTAKQGKPHLNNLRHLTGDHYSILSAGVEVLRSRGSGTRSRNGPRGQTGGETFRLGRRPDRAAPAPENPSREGWVTGYFRRGVTFSQLMVFTGCPV